MYCDVTHACMPTAHVTQTHYRLHQPQNHKNEGAGGFRPLHPRCRGPRRRIIQICASTWPAKLRQSAKRFSEARDFSSKLTFNGQTFDKCRIQSGISWAPGPKFQQHGPDAYVILGGPCSMENTD